MPEKLERITIQAFRAVDFREYTIRYILEHQRVLEDIGVTSALKMDYNWCVDPESTIIAAFHETLGMVGGVRIQLGRLDHPMAMERSICQMDNDFHGVIRPLVAEGTAELCGLWVAHRFAGHGLPKLLVFSGVAVASQLPIKSLLTFAAEYTLQLTVDAGFTRIEETGQAGEFLYPVPNIRSYAMRISDLSELSNSPGSNRAAVMSLRQWPDQDLLTKPKNTLLQVKYALNRDKQRMSAMVGDASPKTIRLKRSA